MNISGKITYLLLLLFFVPCFVGFSQKNSAAYENFMFYHIGTSQGLSETRVSVIYEDKQGYIWFGTQSGLNRWDGYTFTTFYSNQERKKGTLIHNNITTLFEDSHNRLWIGTTEGLSIYFRSTEKIITVYLDENPRNDFIRGITEDKNNNIWIATENGLYKINGLNYKNGFSCHPDKIHLWPEQTIFNIYCTENNKLILGFKGKNILIYDINHKTTASIAYPDNIILGRNGEYIQNFIIDSYGQICFAIYKGGVYTLNPETFEIDKLINKKLPTNLIHKVYEYKKGVYLVATDGSGLFVYYPKDNVLQNYRYNPENPHSLSSNKPLDMLLTSTGQLIISCTISDINIYSPNTQNLNYITSSVYSNSGLSHPSVLSVLKDSQGILWVGTENGLNRRDPGQNNFTYYFPNEQNPTSIKSKTILSLFEDTKGNLWIGNWQGGLNLFNRNKNNFTSFLHEPNNKSSLISNNVWAIEEDSSNNLWIGTHQGLDYFNTKNNTFKHYQTHPTKKNSLASNAIYDICRTKNNKIYIGTTGGGLNVYNPKEDNFIVYKRDNNDKNSINSNTVFHIHEDEKGHLWLSTENGINIFNPKTSKFKKITKKNGLPHNSVRAITQDKNGSFWISTLNGLVKFNKQNKEFKIFKSSKFFSHTNYRKRSVFSAPDGKLYFGSNNGLCIVQNQPLIENITPPKTRITTFKINGKTIHTGDTVNSKVLLKKNISLTQSITIPYEKRTISFEFVGLHYSAPNKNKYAYKLEGLVNKWIYTTANNREAKFINLKPGDYTFKVKSANSDGYWNKKPETIKITILPPWWQTWWAKLLYFAITILLILLTMKVLSIRLKYKHSLEMERLKNTQMRDMYKKEHEIDQLKLIMYTNISHEFRTPLTLITAPLENIINRLNDAELKNEMKVIQKNAFRLLHLIEQMLDLRKLEMQKYKVKLEKRDIVALLHDTKHSFSLMAKTKNIKFDFITNKKSFITYIDVDILEKVLFNLIGNAFKYTPKNGKITIKLSFPSEKTFLVSISDTGKGISKQEQKHIFERFYSAEQGLYKRRGSGIGLALSNDLIKFYGGEISFQSTYQKGSTFYVKFPVYETVPENFSKLINNPETEKNQLLHQQQKDVFVDSEAVQEETVLEESNIDKTKKTLLIAEDNISMKEYLQNQFLSKFNIITANNGKSALKKCEIYHPDIIISDIMMPEMDGIEFCSKIKTDERFNHIPVIMLTAKTTEKIQIESFNTGADAYVSKPFSIDVLLAKINSLIKIRENLQKKYANDLMAADFNAEKDDWDRKFLIRAMKIIEKNLTNDDFNVNVFAAEMGMGRTTFYKKIKSLTTYSANDLIKIVRLKKAAQLLRTSNKSITEIYYDTGFNNGSYFASCFQKQYGVLPSDYRQKHKSN